MDAPVQSTAYPVQLDVDYPDRAQPADDVLPRSSRSSRSRSCSATVSGATQTYDGGAGGDTRTTVVVGAGGLLFAGPLLMILFREKYPRWWFDWNLELTRFSVARRRCTCALLDDRYPSTDEQQALHLDIAYPDVAAAT